MNIPIFGKGNPFAKFFRFGRLTDNNVKEEKEREENSQGYSQEQIDLGYLNYYNNMGATDHGTSFGLSSMSIQFDQYFIVKAQRITKYREMSYYPDINDGLDMICDEAMVEDSYGDYITLDIKEEIPEHIEEQIRDNWNYLINQVFNLNETGWELFRRWLVDGELYLELILNDDGDAIIDFKLLPPYTISPIFDHASDICGYVQTPNYAFGNMGAGAIDKQDQSSAGEGGYNDSTFNDQHGDDGIDEVRFDKDQIIYSNYGYTGRNKLDIRGFLDPSIRLYNQLKYLEDAVVVYRIVRAPERRIWNVGVGKMPKGRAEQYIRGLIQRYRKNVYYDPSTGAMDSSRNFQAMTEDFWFAKDENGYGTEVTTLAGGCFSMDTKVSLLDGRELSIKDIETEMSEGKTLWTYSCHPITGEVVPGLITWAGVTQNSAKVMKLTLDNGEEIICTPDHKFCMYDVGFVRADDLVVGDSLIPLYRKHENINKTTNLKYEQFFDNKSKDWKFTHRMVSDNVVYNIDESCNVRHHINFNRFDNSPENLKFMTWIDHRKLHQDHGFPKNTGTISAKEKLLWIKHNDPELYSYMCNVRSINSKEFWDNLTDDEYGDICLKIKHGIINYYSKLSDVERENRSEISRKNFKIGSDKFHNLMANDEKFRNNVISKRNKYWSDENRSKHSVNASNNSKSMWDTRGDELRKKHQECQKVVFSNSILKAIIDLVKGKTTHEYTIDMVVESLNNNIYIVNEFHNLNIGKNIPNFNIDMGFNKYLIKKCVKQYGYKSWKDFRINESIHNHRVVKIEYLDDEIEVGTLTIDGNEQYHDYHTFALTAGVFTKNSNLGEMEDVYYFERKLHQTMKIPKNRWGVSGGNDASDVYTTGKGGEITREEIAFSRVVGRMQKRFGHIFMDAFMTLLRLQGFDEQYIDETIYRVAFTQSNLWKQYKELEILESRFGILGAIETYIYKPGENDNAPFSMEFVLRNWFLMTDEEYDKNETYLEREKEAARLSGQDVGFDAQGQPAGGPEAGGFGEEPGMGGPEAGMGSGEFGAEGGPEADMGGPEAGGEFGAAEGGAGEFDTGA